MKNFRSLANHFKKQFPELTLSIRRARTPDSEYASCSFADGKFKIVIGNSLDEGAAILAMIHELAHAVSWHTDNHASDHGYRFGIAYATVWRSYLSASN